MGAIIIQKIGYHGYVVYLEGHGLPPHLILKLLTDHHQSPV